MVHSSWPRKFMRGGVLAFFCLLVVGAFLALSLVVAKLADQSGASRLTFLMLALAGAGMVLLGVANIRQQSEPLTGRVLEYAFVSGLVLSLTNALAFLAIRHVGAGFISLSFAFPVLITWIFAVVLGLERIRGLRLLGVLLALAGGVLLAMGKARTSSGGLIWTGLVLTMPMLLAMGNIYRTLRWPAGASPVFLASLMLLAAALLLLPFAVWFESAPVSSFLTSAGLGVLLLVEVGTFSVLYFLFFVLQRLAGPVYLSQIGTVAAVAGTLLAVFALGETAPPSLGLAGLLVGTGMVTFHLCAADRTEPSGAS